MPLQEMSHRCRYPPPIDTTQGEGGRLWTRTLFSLLWPKIAAIGLRSLARKKGGERKPASTSSCLTRRIR